MNETDYRACRIFRALGNPLRYRLLVRLLREPATPGHLAVEFIKPLSTISRHLTILRSLDMIRFNPRSTTSVYSVKYDRIGSLFAEGERFVHDVLEASDPPGRVPRPHSRLATR
jgi:DNA-binding transcriptional ArsR family regulator